MLELNNYIKHHNNPFIKMDYEAKYWIGYIFADGHITYDNKHYNISLFSKNENIIKDFCKFIGSESKFYKRPTGICQGSYNSKPTTYWFKTTFNITNKKALILNPTIDLDWDIIHGYFDGDGCIRLGKTSNKHNERYEAKFTTGSLIWANRIKEFLLKNNINSSIKQKGNAYDINIYNKSNIYKLYKNLYQHNTSKLMYKYNRFVALCSNM